MKLSGVKMSVKIKVDNYSESGCSNDTGLNGLDIGLESQVDSMICDPIELGAAFKELIYTMRLSAEAEMMKANRQP